MILCRHPGSMWPAGPGWTQLPGEKPRVNAGAEHQPQAGHSPTRGENSGAPSARPVGHAGAGRKCTRGFVDEKACRADAHTKRKFNRALRSMIKCLCSKCTDGEKERKEGRKQTENDSDWAS